jgi:hypothetical protein
VDAADSFAARPESTRIARFVRRGKIHNYAPFTHFRFSFAKGHSFATFAGCPCERDERIRPVHQRPDRATDVAALNASTVFYTSAFANSYNGTFAWQLDLNSNTLYLTYTPAA